AIYELCARLGITEWRHASTSHLRQVLPLPDDDQRKLLQSVEKEGWSVRRLQNEIESVALSRTSRSKGGRRRERPLKATLRSVEKCIDFSGRFAGDDGLEIDASPDSARRILATLRRVQYASKSLEARLKRQMILEGERALPTENSLMND